MLLDRGRLLVAELVESLLDFRGEPKVTEMSHAAGSRRSLPVVFRPASSRCARCASESG